MVKAPASLARLQIYRTDAATAETTSVAVAVHTAVEALEVEPAVPVELELPLDELPVVVEVDEPAVVVESEEESVVTSDVEEPELEPMVMVESIELEEVVTEALPVDD